MDFVEGLGWVLAIAILGGVCWFFRLNVRPKTEEDLQAEQEQVMEELRAEAKRKKEELEKKNVDQVVKEFKEVFGKKR
jgi:predicted phage gp36 major capsid-like protein